MKWGISCCRFENTVAAQFHGHTHLEHFNLFYSADDSMRAISAGFVGGSATAFGGVNPNYRIYSVDGDYAGSSYVRVSDSNVISL
jgi:sphingomyelin phosphodiesterase